MTVEQPIGDILRSYADAWTVGDLERIFDAYHEDFTLHYFGQSPLAGSHRGKAAALQALAEATARTNRALVKIVDVLEGEQLGALVVVERLGADDQAREVHRLLVYRAQDGKLAECWLYDQDQRFVDELWSAQPG